MVRRFLAIKSLLENSVTAFGNHGITPQLRGHTERSPGPSQMAIDFKPRFAQRTRKVLVPGPRSKAR